MVVKKVTQNLESDLKHGWTWGHMSRYSANWLISPSAWKLMEASKHMWPTEGFKDMTQKATEDVISEAVQVR